MTIVEPGAAVAPQDKYLATAGRIQLTGIQALARLPIEQHRLDLAAGRNVATFISGYEGSPLAGFDLELGRQRALLEANDVTFVPGLNEESAATALQGSQLANTFAGATREGVVGIWYGKAPGLDRATDAIRHGNLMGAHPQGGALLLVGDDPAAKSSSVPCSSEMALADLAVPFLYPADSQDVIDLGLHAIELSRVSGLYVGLKMVTAVADGSSTVQLGVERPLPVLPRGAKKHAPRRVCCSRRSDRWSATWSRHGCGWPPSTRPRTASIVSSGAARATPSGSSPVAGPGRTCWRPWHASASPSPTWRRVG